MNIKKCLIAALTLCFASSNLQAQMITKDDKILVVYYSKSGNTKEIANQIHGIVGGDIFEIQPVVDYPQEYSQLTTLAKKEISEGYRPALKNKVENIQDYNIIFVGSPCWWSTIAPPVATFLSDNALSGKTIIPFMTHGGSGLGHSVEDIKKQLPNSTVSDGKAFVGKNARDSQADVTKWLKGMKHD